MLVWKRIEKIDSDVQRLIGLVEEVNKRLDRIELAIVPPQAAKILFQVTLGGNKLEVSSMMMKVNQSLPISIKPVDQFGNAAAVDGIPAWSLSDPAMGSIAVAQDGMSAQFTPAGQVGSVVVQVSADADLGAGIVSIMGSLQVDLLAGDAVAVQITAGAPV
jgi:hypothetical protein